MKKKIIILIGIIVAILITFYTGVFGISFAASSTQAKPVALISFLKT
jgi:hypothetical protein